jgi:hypothetical protein
MKVTLTFVVALLAYPAAMPARPFETEAQIEARFGSRWCNCAQTDDYMIVGYLAGDGITTWVMYVGGISEGEISVRSGPIPDMEVASLLDANKGQSNWQAEKVQGASKGSSERMWSRKDGRLYAYVGSMNNQTIVMIGTKKAQRLMGDVEEFEKKLKPRDRIQ